MSAKEGSPMADCSLKTAILRTESSSLPSRCTRSGTLMSPMVSGCRDGDLAACTLCLDVVLHSVRADSDGMGQR